MNNNITITTRYQNNLLARILKTHHQKLEMIKLNFQEVDWNIGEATPVGTAKFILRRK